MKECFPSQVCGSEFIYVFKMRTFAFAVIAAFCISAIVAEDPLWSDLRGSFLIGKEDAFAPFPRTIRDSIFTAENYTATSSTENDCTNGGKFNGIQYVRNNDYSVGLLYDVGGTIAGIQMMIPHDTVLTNNSRQNYAAVPAYQNVTHNDTQYFILTVYFVDPATICDTGRTDEDLETEGTGTGLWLQNGPSPTDTLQIPATRPEGDEARESGWTKNNCFLAMGYHNFYQADQYVATNCTQLTPIFALYNKDHKLHGFGFITPGTILNSRFEQPPKTAIKMILGKMDEEEVPQCILDIQEQQGLTSLHVYFTKRPWFITCSIFRALGFENFVDSARNWLSNLG